MAGKIPEPTAREVRRAAREHASNMRMLHKLTLRVAVSAARLTEMFERADGSPFAGGLLYDRVDAVIGELDTAYNHLAVVFDDLESTQ